MLRATLTDDRGRTVTLSSRGNISQDAGERRRIETLWYHSKSRMNTSDRIAQGLVAAVLLGGCMLSPSLSDPAVIVVFAVGVTVCIVGIAACWKVGARTDRRRRVDGCAKARGMLPPVRLCLSCDYDLASLKTEPDGRRVCPECGAAWFGPTDSERPESTGTSPESDTDRP